MEMRARVSSQPGARKVRRAARRAERVGCDTLSIARGAKIQEGILPVVSRRKRSISETAYKGRRVARDGFSKPRSVRRSTVTALMPSDAAASLRVSASLGMLLGFDSFVRLVAIFVILAQPGALA